jgi:selenide,water dikinase
MSEMGETEKPRLTEYTRFSGCGAKLGPGTLEKALCGLAQPAYPDLLADFSGCEDAGLFRVAEGLALVQTVDFFPPIVDDPALFGRIAAANALSDVYAMGGRPITALALVCFPARSLGLEALRAMMEGGLGALVEAGCALVGGHSIEDAEPKLGYAVTGLVGIGEEWRNNSLRAGQAIILTKPIGTGLVNMAVRAGCASPEARSASEASMARLNKAAAEVLSRFPVCACTDVTGFGLAGHAAEMAAGPECGLRLFASAVPLLPGAADYAAMGLVPEGAYRNREGRGRAVAGLGGLSPALSDILFDPQTSGGLLAALPRECAEDALAALRGAGVEAAAVGESGGPRGVVELAG